MFVQYIRENGEFVKLVLPFSDLHTSELGGRYLMTYLDQIPSRDYILCITYNNGKTQLGITGTMKRGEGIISAIYREVLEETGLVIDHCVEMLGTHSSTRHGKDLLWNVGICNLSENLQQIEEQSDLVPEHDERSDDRTKKIAVFIHGTLNDWTLLFGSLSDKILEHYIIGLSLIRRDDAQRLFFVNDRNR
jgi:hypothetical protein